jgi:hypothetical protein
MALKIASVEGIGDQITVIVENDNLKGSAAVDELKGPEARKMAIAEAAKRGLTSPAVNGMLMHPYPVTYTGELLTDAKTQRTAAYRIDIPIRAGLR